MLKYLTLLLALFIAEATAGQKMLIGIAGGTGSGKTTVAERLLEAFQDQAVIIAQDAYYKDLSHLSPEERDAVNFDHPDSLDFSLLCKHLVALQRGVSIEVPIYNFQLHIREKKTQRIMPTDLIIIEGILLFAVPELRELFDLKIYVDTDDDIRILRRMERDIRERGRTFEGVRDQYLATVKPMHEVFVAPSKYFADLIIPHGGENSTAIAVIASRLKEQLLATTVK